MDPQQQQAAQQDAGAQQTAQPSTAEPSPAASSSDPSTTMAQPSAGNPVLAQVPAPDPAKMTPEQVQEMVQKQVDKNNAMLELSQKLKVTDPNADPNAEKAPNSVSPEEFNRLAEQYAAIKRGDTDLQINTDGMKEKDAKAFKDGTMNDIGSLMQTASGREMLNNVTDNENIATGEHHTTTISKVPEGKTIYDSSSESPTANAVNGIGEDAKVEYSPGESAMIPGTPIGGPNAPATKSDVVLMHELNHAYHETRGEVAEGKADPVKPEDKGVAAEEYQTVGLGGHGTISNGNNIPMSENDYRAERRKLGENVPERQSYNRTQDDYNNANATP